MLADMGFTAPQARKALKETVRIMRISLAQVVYAKWFRVVTQNGL